MATVFNTEKSQFMQSAANILAQNKTSQYTKYLDSNPIMVTYYSVNEVMSRMDIGTGQIYDELGPQSPFRYNKILNFPVYNIGTIQPSQTFEDGHFDADIDISDIVILPNTPEENAFLFAERFRREIEKMEFIPAGEEEAHKVTISAGISTYPCMTDVEEDANTVIRYAEHALYNAKHRGRNKIAELKKAVAEYPIRQSHIYL